MNSDGTFTKKDALVCLELIDEELTDETVAESWTENQCNQVVRWAGPLFLYLNKPDKPEFLHLKSKRRDLHS